MPELTIRKNQLPAKPEELVKFIMIGQEAVKAQRAKINAVKKADHASAAYYAALSDGQDVAEIVIDAEVKLGEMLAEIPPKRDKQSSTKRTSLTSLPDGVDKKISHKAQTLARHQKVVDQAKEVARDAGELITTSQVIRAIKKKEKACELKIAKAKNKSQVAKKPLVPKVWLQSWDKWLATQDQCDLLITDPPYMTDVKDVCKFSEWLPTALKKVKPTGSAYVFIGAYPEELHAYLDRAMPAQILVWTYRNTLGQSPKNKYKLNWQAILYYRMKDAGPLDCPVTNELFAVQDINAPDGRIGDRVFKWQKPDDLCERLIRHSSQPGDVIIDPFAGSGSFLVAAAKLDRKGMGCDTDKDALSICAERGCRVFK